MSLAFLYAGQGTQHPGMGADLYERYPAFRSALDEVCGQVDFDLKETMFTDPHGVLNQTRYTQPCMVALAAGMTAVLAQRGIRPDYAAGLSLGVNAFNALTLGVLGVPGLGLLLLLKNF